jgi:poly-gamma-glutamate synthesis protein (capsule biosynthesis protein)
MTRMLFRLAPALLVPALGLALAAGGRVRGSPAGPAFADTIENFDDGDLQLRSFPGEDLQPDSWILDTHVTYNNSPYSLKLYGNTWKLESIAPRSVDSGDVWQVAMYTESLGEIQGFGLVTQSETLFYSFAGTEEVNPETWVTVYQGAFALRSWNLYDLPVGQDWLARFGHLPTIIGLVFINDKDAGARAKVYFDEITDITGDLPVAPQVELTHTLGDVFRGAGGQDSVPVQFHSRVIDPDSRSHDYFWYFGDDSTSSDSNPSHTYLVEDNHDYTVLLAVEDSTGLWGRASCRIHVDPGPTSFPVKMNFTGDIMLARRYDDPGGLIDSLGVNAIFDPTLPYLGNAADITVANLEGPITAQGTRHPTKPIVFRGKPRNMAGLAHAGIDVVSLANNHVIDYGLAGMREMQESLAANRILYSGAGANSYEAYLPVFCQKSGVNVAFLAACDRNGQYDNYQPYLDAGLNKPGFAMLDTFHLRQQIRAVEGDADVIVVELHTGEEYVPTPEALGNDEGLRGNDEVQGDEFYSRFARFPAPGDTEERHRAIEAGADLVVCHHPHLLQGFEVYQGKLIAHSLGDFTFDLDYPETYPTVILNGAIDATGFYDYSLTPVYLDDYIPVRARGELGSYILDYLARRSRDLGTWLITNRDSVTARIILDTTALPRTVYPHSDELQLREENGYWVSNPLRLPRNGSLSRVVSATPSRNWQFRVGREMLWFGNMEDEGSTLWLLNQTGEGYDTVARRGSRSMRQVRSQGSSAITTNLEERIVCYSDSTGYTLCGHLKTGNAKNAGAAVEFYTTRPGGSPIGSSDLGTQVSGTTDWTFYYNNFTPAANTQYFDVWLTSEAPQTGDGNAWFDDVSVIEWEDWQPLSGPASIPAPNDLYWVQIRADAATASATLSYEETDFNPPVNVAQVTGRGPMFRSFQTCPNPAGAAPAIRYSLTASSRVTLRIYNVLGQEVRTLVNGTQANGPKSVLWDRKDNRGRIVGAGTYFCRLQAGQREQTKQLILLR